MTWRQRVDVWARWYQAIDALHLSNNADQGETEAVRGGHDHHEATSGPRR
jgi:hypothetical protein